MDSRDILVDAASRCVDASRAVLSGLTPDVAHTLPADRGNSIAWLLWHAARQMDFQIAEISGRPQVWAEQDWATSTGIDRDAQAFGFGDTLEDVESLVVTDPATLGAYLEAVVRDLSEYVRTLSDADLDDIVDTRWDPPVTRGVRIVSTIDDATAHLGQAAYARGLIESWSIGY